MARAESPGRATYVSAVERTHVAWATLPAARGWPGSHPASQGRGLRAVLQPSTPASAFGRVRVASPAPACTGWSGAPDVAGETGPAVGSRPRPARPAQEGVWSRGPAQTQEALALCCPCGTATHSRRLSCSGPRSLARPAAAVLDGPRGAAAVLTETSVPDQTLSPRVTACRGRRATSGDIRGCQGGRGRRCCSPHSAQDGPPQRTTLPLCPQC